ncbi:hypothetical protein NADFUDRAFT_44366 [Nadsonia fulvescens var. elongata DSM 6958]|uniref:Uncharacterized protein n=1 Tax=Nadsonia fulvescens var. elongata DSM 6958 TaxID=857566 RepID=A0A1E3PDP7_9ASCO|nr:hypothetical protein NADFUDRAFT_44366 [Nadsonia fulvescens var. elongata DSM 6958]
MVKPVKCSLWSSSSNVLPRLLSNRSLNRYFHIESANTTTQSRSPYNIENKSSRNSNPLDYISRQSLPESSVLPAPQNLVQIKLKPTNSTLDLSYSNTSIVALSRLTGSHVSPPTWFDSVFITPRSNKSASFSSSSPSSVDVIQITLDGSRDLILMDQNCSIVSSRSDRKGSSDTNITPFSSPSDSLNIPTVSTRYLRASNARGTRIPLSHKLITGRGSLHLAPSKWSTRVKYNSCRAIKLAADESMVVDINHLLAYDCDSDRGNNLNHQLQMFNIASLDAQLVSSASSDSLSSISKSSKFSAYFKQYLPRVPSVLTIAWAQLVAMTARYQILRTSLAQKVSVMMNQKKYITITGPSTVIFSTGDVAGGGVASRQSLLASTPPPFLVDEVELGKIELPKVNESSVAFSQENELRPIDCLKVVTVNGLTGDVTFRSTESFLKKND